MHAVWVPSPICLRMSLSFVSLEFFVAIDIEVPRWQLGWYQIVCTVQTIAVPLDRPQFFASFIVNLLAAYIQAAFKNAS